MYVSGCVHAHTLVSICLYIFKPVYIQMPEKGARLPRAGVKPFVGHAACYLSARTPILILKDYAVSILNHWAISLAAR